MKSSIAIKFPENFEARVTFTGIGTLDFHSFRVIIEPSTFRLEVESAGKLTMLNGTHSGAINLRHIDSRLYVGDGTKWSDSAYSPEIVTSSVVEVSEGLDITGLTATEIFDVYAEPLSGTPERVALVAPWDVFADRSPEATVIDSEYATEDGSIADIPEAGLTLHALPMDMRNDFCLAFSIAVDVVDPDATVVEQNNFKVLLSGSTFSVTIGADTATLQVVKSDDYLVVIDRFGSQVSLNVNGEVARFNVSTTSGKADRSIWFGEGEFEGKFLSLAFIARSVLKGRQPNGSRPIIITHAFPSIPGDLNRKWMRVADCAMIAHTGEEGSSLSIGLRVLKDGDFSLFKDVLEVVGGKLMCSGQELAEVELNTDIRFSMYFGAGLTVTVEGKSATINVNTIQGDWPGSYAEVFSFTPFPSNIQCWPLTATTPGLYLNDTSEDSTGEILPDLGPSTAYSNDGGVGLYGLVPGSTNAFAQAVGLVGGIVPEDNVGWIKVTNANNTMFIAKRPLAFGADIPEEKRLDIDGRVFAVRSLRSDEWRDIMYRLSALNVGSDERIGSLRQFNSDYIGLTKDGVPAISAAEGGRAFKGLNEELTEEQLSQVEPATIGWRPVLELLEE